MSFSYHVKYDSWTYIICKTLVFYGEPDHKVTFATIYLPITGNVEPFYVENKMISIMT